MASEVLNFAKGRANEFQERVNNNDPVNSVLVLVLLTANEADTVLRDYNDLGALLGAPGNTEAVDASYARIVLTDTDLGPTVEDDALDRRDADLADQTWTALDGVALTKLLICYDSDSTGGTDANIVVCTQHDFVIDPNGGDVTAQIADWFQAA